MNLVGLVEALKAAFGGSRNVDPFSVSPREAVRDIPSYRESGDLAKYLRGLEAELSEFSMPRKYWRGVLLSKLPSKVKNNVVEVVESGGSYQELKRALLKRVGPSLVS